MLFKYQGDQYMFKRRGEDEREIENVNGRAKKGAELRPEYLQGNVVQGQAGWV